MKVSVALCTYNGAAFLNAQLESIANQTHLPDELVVGDDASEDTTVDIVQSFATQVPFSVRLEVNSSRLGTSQNFGATIGRCRGDAIFLADQDDVWQNHKVKTMLEEITQYPYAGLFFSDALVVDSALRPMGYTIWDSVRFTSDLQKKVNQGHGLDVLLKQDIVTGATVAFRTDVQHPYLPIPDNWLHDAWLAHIFSIYSDIRAVPCPLILYRQHAAQQIGGRRRASMDKALEIRYSPPDVYRQRVERMARLQVYLQQTIPPDEVVLAKIVDKQVHFARRAGLPAQRLRRLKPIWQEWRNGRYHRYSAGTSSAIKDLWLSSRYFRLLSEPGTAA